MFDGAVSSSFVESDLEASEAPRSGRVRLAARAKPSAAEVRAFVVDHHAFTWRMARRLGVAESAVDDAVQQIFMVVTARLADIEPGKERSFLVSTIMRVAANVRRAQARVVEMPWNDDPPEIASPAPTPEESLAQAQRRAVLDDVLAPLPDDLKTVFVLAELEELSAPQIASIVDAPVGTVTSRLRRARELVERRGQIVRARLDGPRAGSLELLLVALGIGAGVTAIPAPAAAAPSATTAAATGTATKIAIVAAIAIGVVAGAVIADRLLAKPTPTVVARAAVSSEVPASPTSATPVTTPDALPDAPPAKKAEAAKEAARVATLSEQVELVDAARTELAAGKADAALVTTRTFDQKFGAGAALHPEMMLVAVQAHLARGDAEAAQRTAASLEKQHPASAAAQRAAELVGERK